METVYWIQIQIQCSMMQKHCFKKCSLWYWL